MTPCPSIIAPGGRAGRPPRVAMGDAGGPFCARVQPFTAEAQRRQPATVPNRIERMGNTS